jgi:ABC-2 type transport system ATP-binding protein
MTSNRASLPNGGASAENRTPLSHEYHRNPKSHAVVRPNAVHDLNLSVQEGSVCALLGPNGAGKSTTIKMLMNLLRPSSGEAVILGVNSARLGPSELTRIGYVSENQKLPVWMTVRQLLDYCRPFYPTWDMSLERQLLRLMDLPEDRRLSHLSRGMLMKAALLSSLAYRPKLLVLDEPFSGLDPQVREELVKGIIEVSSTGDWTVLVSSHDIEEVERMTDCVALLASGSLQLSEPIAVLQGRFRRMEVELPPPRTAAGTALPSNWLLFESSGHRASFVTSAYVPGETERSCAERFAGATVSARPMTLREIFLAIARTHRTESKGVAA